MTLEKDLGRLQGEMEGVNREIGEIKKHQGEMKTDIRSILTTLSEARGGWKTFLLVAGFAGVMGAMASKLAMLTNWLPK